jgi:UBX domain-containing protein 1
MCIHAARRQAAFTGTGRTLGGGSSSTSTGVPAASVTVEGVWEGVNESQPVTSLQLRLVDGSRMVSVRVTGSRQAWLEALAG